MPTPEQWLARLDTALEARRPVIDLFDAYYHGRHRLAFATSKYREVFGRMLRDVSDNWSALVVDASSERLGVDGFRFGPDESADAEAWDIWQFNEMDAQSAMAHTEAIKSSIAYAMVGLEDGEPVITVEHPAQCIVAHAPGMRRRRTAALKKWVDDDGFVRANLMLPDVLFKFRSREVAADGRKVEWVAIDDGEDNEHGLGVPLVPLINEPTMLGGGISDLAVVLPQQDILNKLMADMIVASEFAGFRQRFATGVEIPNDPVTGAPMNDQFLSSVSRMWTVPDPDAKFGEFNPTDLSNYVRAMEMVVQHIAALTRTPPHYLLGQSGAFPSGESLKSTETGLVAKVRRKQTSFGESWEEVLRLSFLARGDLIRGNARNAETLWRDPESRTTAEQTDAAIKEIAAGIPREMVWARRLGMSPQEIARAKAMAATEAFFTEPALPAPAVASTGDLGVLAQIP
jgi:hypothetical protein